MQRSALFLAWMIAFSQVFAQRADIITYTPRDGLINNRTRFIFQDSRGKLYISTFGGLSVYDGSRFTNYSTENGLAASLVNQIIELGDDSLWIIPNTRRLQYLVHGVIKSSRTADDFVPVINQLIRCSDGFYYALADEGLYRFNKNRFDKVEVDDHMSGRSVINLIHGAESGGKLYISSDPNIHTFSRNCLFMVYDLKTGKSIVTRSEDPIYFVSVAPDGNILLSTQNGIFRVANLSFDSKSVHLADAVGLYHLPSHSKAANIFFDRQGNTWLLAFNGVVRIDRSGRSKLFTTQTGLAENEQESMLEDRENIIWLAGAHSGISKLVNQDIGLYTELPGGFRSTILDVDDTSDSVWLYDFNRNEILLHTGRFEKIFHGGKEGSFTNMASVGGKLYLTKWFEMYKVNVDNRLMRFSTTLTMRDTSAANGFSCLLHDSAQNIIAVSDKLTVQLQSGEVKYAPLGYLADEASIIGDRLWVVTRAGKLFLFRVSGRNADHYFQLLEEYDNALRGAAPRSITVGPQGNIWVGTRDHGIYLFSHAEDRLTLLRHFTTRDGLSENFASYLHRDRSDNIWVCSPAGLDRIVMVKGKYYVENITRSVNTFQQVFKISTERSGMHWGIGDAGLLRISDSFFTVKNYTPRLQFVQIKIGDSLVFPGRTAPELSYLQNNLSFYVAAPAFCDERQTRFSYLLSGSSENNWSEPSVQADIHFVNLEPGNYTLRVRASFLNGLYAEQNAEWSFSISPPWWQSWWFRSVIVLVLIAGIIFFVVFYYNRKFARQRIVLEKQQLVEQERTRIATDMHDDLGAGLSRIKFLSETVDIKSRQQKPIEEDIVKIKEYSNEMINKMGEIVWALNEKNDSLKDLLAYSRSYAAEYLSQNSIHSDIRIADDVPDLFVSGEIRRNIYLTLKEALHNIVKHAAATEVTISVEVGRVIDIVVQDNGRGFDQHHIRPFSNGLSSMKKRIADIGGKFEIRSGTGTQLRITVPLWS